MTVPQDVVVAAAYQMNQLEHRPHNYDIGKAIERAILSERERHADVVAAARALLDGAVAMEVTPETDDQVAITLSAF